MTDSRSGGTQLLVTTLLAAVAVGAVLLIDAYMQDDLHEPIASNEAIARPENQPGDEDAHFDPGAACWGPLFPQICVPPLVPSDEEDAQTAANEPVAAKPMKRRAPKQEELPLDMSGPEEVALPDRVFSSVIDAWYAPKACATAVGVFSGTPTVRVEMDIDETGRVQDARALDVDDTTEQELASCLEARARALRFPPEEVRRKTTRDATFVF